MTHPQPRTVLVAGGTGRLGRPLVRLLLERGHSVRALTRHPSSDAARELDELGAQPVAGDFDDPASLTRAIVDVEVVFGAGTAHQAGPEGEARHGVKLADAVKAGGEPFLVYASGAGAEQTSGVPVFESKRAVEQHIAELGLRSTVLAPVYFMENAFNPWNLPALSHGRFALPLPGDRVLQQVAIADVVSFAGMVIEHTEEFAGQRIELASDQLTGVEAAAAVSRVSGRDFQFERMPLDRLAPPLRLLFQWLDQVGHAVDIPALQRGHAEIAWHSFESWAATQDWARLATAVAEH